jgi:hypothetical protein
MSIKYIMNYIEIDKLTKLKEKCPPDEWYWFSYDITETGGHKAFIGIRQESIHEYEDSFKINKNLYEILPSEQTIHPYFDLEMEGVTNHQYLLKKFLDWLNLIFQTEFHIPIAPIILDSCRENKLSYHVIIGNCLFPSVQDMKPFVLWLYEQLNDEELHWIYQEHEPRKIMDKLPYGHNQNIRMINQSKRGKPYILKGEYRPLETLIRSKDGVLLNTEKYKSKRVATQSQLPNSEGMTEKQVIYHEEFMEYYKYNLFNRIAMEGTWEDWRNAGFAIYNTFQELGLPLFVLFSKINPKKYNEKDTLALYKSLKVGGSKKITFHSIRSWAKKSDHKMFKRIFTMYIEKLEERYYCDNDEDASNAILELLDDRLIYANQHYFKINNTWTTDSETIKASLLSFILSAPIFKQDEKGNSIPYWKNYSSADKVVKVLLAKTSLEKVDSHLFHVSTKHKLCFKNGVLNMKTKQFTLWDDVKDVFSVIQIPYDYYPSSIELQKDIVRMVFEPLFGDKLELGLNYIARSLAGCIEDKNFATYSANRNCGKGVTYEALKQAFGEYIQTVLISNVMCSRDSKETARDMYWLMELEYARLAISQEIPKDFDKMKFKPEIIKKICSGGDTIVARRNYDKRDTHFNVDCSMFFFGNGDFNVDGDLTEHYLYFESAYQFKDQSFIDAQLELYRDETDPTIYTKQYRVADPSLKDKFHLLDWKRAVVDIIVNYYIDKPITVERDCEAEPSTLQEFLQEYEITRNPVDLILMSSIKHFAPNMKSQLQVIGLKVEKSKKGDATRDKLCVFGVKSRNNPPTKTCLM